VDQSAAIDRKCDACNEIRLIGSKKQGRVRNTQAVPIL
jgi:hypothetical protein